MTEELEVKKHCKSCDNEYTIKFTEFFLKDLAKKLMLDMCSTCFLKNHTPIKKRSIWKVLKEFSLLFLIITVPLLIIQHYYGAKICLLCNLFFFIGLFNDDIDKFLMKIF